MEREPAPAFAPPAVAGNGNATPPDDVRPRVPWLRAWRERRFIARCCRRLGALHAEVQRDAPGLRGPALYVRVVQRDLGVDTATAELMLEQAEDSYTRWPNHRPLTFRDVVHYLAVAGLCDGPGGHAGVISDVRPVIDRWLPSRW